MGAKNPPSLEGFLEARRKKSSRASQPAEARKSPPSPPPRRPRERIPPSPLPAMPARIARKILPRLTAQKTKNPTETIGKQSIWTQKGQLLAALSQARLRPPAAKKILPRLPAGRGAKKNPPSPRPRRPRKKKSSLAGAQEATRKKVLPRWGPGGPAKKNPHTPPGEPQDLARGV